MKAEVISGRSYLQRMKWTVAKRTYQVTSAYSVNSGIVPVRTKFRAYPISLDFDSLRNI